MFAILKVSKKWRFFDRILFNEIPMGWLIIVKSKSESFSTTYALFWTCLPWKRIHNIVGTTVQVIWLNVIFSLDTKRSKCFSSLYMFGYFAPSTSAWSVRAFFFSKGTTFALTRISFKLLTLLNPTIGILSKTFPCSLSCVTNKGIWDSSFTSFQSSGWYVVLKTNLLSFPTRFVCLKLLASKIF